MTQRKARQYEAVEPGSSTGARALKCPINWNGLATGASPLGQAPQSWSTMTRMDRLPTSHQRNSACNPQRRILGLTPGSLQPLQPSNPP